MFLESGRNPFEVLALSGLGEIYTYSIVHYAPTEFNEFVPYIVALVKLKEGPLVTAQITDINPHDVYIGMPVEIVTRKLSENGETGLIHYGSKFRPLLRTT